MQKRWFCLTLLAILSPVGFASDSPVTTAVNPSVTESQTLNAATTVTAQQPPVKPQTTAPVTITKQSPPHSLKTLLTLASADPTEAAAQKKLKDKVTRSIEHYENEIVNIESQDGVYEGRIEEQLLSLGLAQQYMGKHEKAIKIYKRAIHLNRINEGLYSTSQIPIIKRLINSHMAMAQWSKVDERYQYLYWLSKQNYGEDDIRLLPTLNQLSKWHLQAYAMGIGKDSDTVTTHLVEAYGMFEKSVELLSNQYGPNDQRLIDDLNGLTLSNYFFATFQKLPLEQHGSNVVSDIGMRRSTQMINQFIANSFRRGKESLARVIDIHANDENATPWAVAKAKVKMADWLLMFNKRNSAIELYQEAYNSLTDEETQLERSKMFVHPVALPHLDMLENNTYSEVDERQYDKQRDYVLASFDVTPQGKTTNIEILESQPVDNTSVRSRVKKSLRLARFRPRFIEGEPVFSEKVTLRILSPQR